MKAIFLDRDGVINKHPGDNKYVTRRRDFHFLPGVRKTIAKLHKKKFGIFVVSNQAGVGKGIFKKETLDAITKKMLDGVRDSGGRISGVFYCLHRKEDDCSCRKPKSGLIDMAKSEFPIDLSNSFFIGDSIRDIKTAKRAGCKSILVLSGQEKLSNRSNWEVKPDYVFADLEAAAEFVLLPRKE